MHSAQSTPLAVRSSELNTHKMSTRVDSKRSAPETRIQDMTCVLAPCELATVDTIVMLPVGSSKPDTSGSVDIGCETVAATAGDRKSTRLNSSHT